MVKFDELNKTEKEFVMYNDFFGIDQENNITNDKGQIVTDHLDIMRELEHYENKDD